MSATQTYSLAVLLDEKRLKAVKGTKLEGLLTNMFGGAIKAFILSVPADQTKTLLSEFPRSRTDARGFIEELPVAFKRALFEEVVRSNSVGPTAMGKVIERLPEIKKSAASEEEYLPPPEL